MSYPKNSPEPKPFAEASDETIAAYVIDLIELDSQSDEIQNSRKRTYEDARDTYGKKFARSLKRAVALHRMDDDKRTEADEIDAEAERFLAIINAPRAPRATRVASDVPHDPETGEITDPRHGAGGAEDEALVAADIGAPSSAQPIQAETPNQYAAASGVVESRNDTGGDHDNSAEKVGAPVIIEPETLLPAVVSDAGDRDTAETSDAAIPVVPRTHNPETHFLNSEGLARLHGCLKPETCSGTWRALCSRCAVHEAPMGGAA